MSDDRGQTGAPREAAAEAGPAAPRRRVLVRVAWGIAIAAGTMALALAVDLVTASPRLCASCHEMTPRVAAWAESEHSGVACVTCHQPPTAWYAIGQRLADRTSLFVRDTVRHTAGGYQDPVESRGLKLEPMSDSVCLQCHDPGRKVTSGLRILIDHAKHAERNGSCVSCHLRTAHPEKTRGTALTLMAQCFACHGRASTAKASAECDLCHPKGYELLPGSHGPATWKSTHGAVARADLRQCEMCHEKSACDGCHGIDMPHPMGWSEGTPGHGPDARRDRELCMRCHGTKPDWCEMCHHEGYAAGRGPWIGQHSDELKTRGLPFCLDCHSQIECTSCHMDRFGERRD